MGERFSAIIDYVLAPFAVFGFGERMDPSSFVVFAIVGLAAYAHLRRKGEAEGVSALGYLFPRSIYLSQSSLVDLKVYLAQAYVVFDRIGIRVLSTSAVATWVSSAILSVTGEPGTAAFDGWRWALCLVCVAAAYDFGGYWLHRFSHENPVLWPFHKVHHSAEGLTPLTVARIHPVYGLIGSFFVPIAVGPVLGVIYAVFGVQDGFAITAVNSAYMIFSLAGANLRHSHIWLSYGPVASRVLVSPAMHQIHHSIDPKHWNKNYAEIFALWDWAFGTLYVPREREELAFGLGRDADGAVIQPHPTLKAAMVGPFLEAGAAIRKAIAARMPRPSCSRAAASPATETPMPEAS